MADCELSEAQHAYNDWLGSGEDDEQVEHRPCSNPKPHLAHDRVVGEYLPVGDLGHTARCPGIPMPATDLVHIPGFGTSDDYGRAAARQRRIARATTQSRPKWVAPVGQITLHVFDQDVQWVDAQGHVVALDDMEERWKVNILQYLERNAARFEMMAAHADLWLGGDPYGHNAPDDVVDGIAKRTPQQWLESKPLYQRLVKDVYGDRPF